MTATNNTLRCVIIDDEEMATKVIESHLREIEDVEIMAIYHSGVEAFLDIEKLNPDLIFLDIEMPKLSGLSLLKMMKIQPLVVLTTAHREYALESYDLDVVDYLLKPISFERFLRTIQKIRRFTRLPNGMERASIQLRVNRRMVRIHLDEILYIESIKNHVRVHLEDEKLISLITITAVHEMLNDDFSRVHRSFIVNCKKVDSYTSKEVTIRDAVLPVGKSYRDDTLNSLGIV